jgi:hypothetical protein
VGEVADLVEAEQVEPGLAIQDAGELFVVGGFGEPPRLQWRRVSAI